MSITLEGNDCLPAESGGYLTLSLDDSALHMVGVPAPHFGAESHEESVVENHDEIEDDEGNIYTINVCSSNEGVDWIVEVQALERELEVALRSRLSVCYRAGSPPLTSLKESADGEEFAANAGYDLGDNDIMEI